MRGFGSSLTAGGLGAEENGLDDRSVRGQPFVSLFGGATSSNQRASTLSFSPFAMLCGGDQRR